MKKQFTFLKSFRLLLVLAGLALSTAALAQNGISHGANWLDAKSNHFLKRNEPLRSASGLVFLIVQDDGNMCLYKTNNRADISDKARIFIWGTMTQGKDGAIVKMQSDGNLCLYDSKSGFLWGTDTYRGDASKLGSKMVVEDSGQLVLYNAAGTPIWNNTKGRLY